MDVYPLNKPWNFKVQLSSPLIVKDGCRVGVAEVHCSDDLKREMHILSNICEESRVGINARAIMRIVHPQADQWIRFNPIYYVSTRYSEIRDIEILITDKHGHFYTVLKKPLSVTLCFK